MSTSGGGPTGSRLIGAVLDGRYRVGATIARGGMSTVYRGVDLRLDRPVAIKVMKPSFASDPSFLTRFEREARLAAGLAHRGVVAVYDHGRDEDVVFLVMELVDGGTLRDLIRQSDGLSVSVTMSILEPLLSALGAAHAAGLVHRDVKPENVLISSKGDVKIADFGLVRAVSSQTMATGDVILGTVAYLSPEQVATGAADPRSDVYSAGIVAFEMLTGHPPYVGDNAISVAYQHVHSDVPPVTDQAPGVPVELDDLILAATRRDPMARPRDASAFLSALVSIRARLGLARAVVPVPHEGAAPAPRSSASAGGARSARPRNDQQPFRSAGPTGTRVVGGTGTVDLAGAPTTVGRGSAAVAPAGAHDPTLAHTASGRPEQMHTRPGRPPQPKRPSKVRRWLIVAIVVLLLGAAAAVGGWWLGSGRWAYLPPTAGVDQQSAQTLVRNAGLIPQVTTEPNNTVAEGKVVDTQPAAGARVLKGSDVEMVVSTGRPVVPDIRAGTTVADATRLVTAAHLTPKFNADSDQYNSSVPAGAVLSTDPAADTPVPIAAQVVIVRSKGPPPQPVPAVAGKTVEDARNKLLVAGFTVGSDQQTYNADVDNGSVLGTDPAEGELVTRGGTVSLVIATSLTVPGVRGESTSQAVGDLQQAGFTVKVGDPAFDADLDAGAAVGTSPVAGARIDPADPTVVLTVSDAVTVPDLTKGDVGSARQQLSDLGLVPDVSALFGASGASVIGQSPAGGARVAPGSTVLVSAFP